LMAYQHAHEHRTGGVALSGTAVTVTVVNGPTASGTVSEVRALIDSHPGGDGDYSVDIKFVEHSYSDLYAIMYVLPGELGVDIAQTRVHCSIDVLRNRVKAQFEPLTPEIATTATERWGPMIEVEPLPAGRPRLVTIPVRRARD
jgi:hypothetical protein